MIEKNWNAVIKFVRERHGENIDGISDVHNGELLSSILKQNPYTLSFLVNSDGVSLKKANFFSLHPIQLVCNALPPHLRYNKSNIIIAGLSYGKTKPDLNEFMLPLAEELQSMETEGVNNTKFDVYITHAVFDLD